MLKCVVIDMEKKLQKDLTHEYQPIVGHMSWEVCIKGSFLRWNAREDEMHFQMFNNCELMFLVSIQVLDILFVNHTSQ